jgi:hypothetical protein
MAVLNVEATPHYRFGITSTAQVYSLLLLLWCWTSGISPTIALNDPAEE